MIIAAVIVGLLTANYFGVRPGVIAAAATALAFLVAAVVPEAKLPVYVIVGGFTLAVSLLGPKLGRPAARTDVLRLARKAVMWSAARLRDKR